MKKWVAVAVLLLLPGAAVTQQQAEQLAKAFHEAQDAMKAKDFDTVITACEKVLTLSPETFLCNYWLGYAYATKKQWGKSGQNFSRYLEEIAKKPEATSNPQVQEMVNAANRQAGIALARTGRSRDAIPYLEKAVAAKPNDKQAYFLLGMAFLTTGNESKAEAHLNKVIQLDPAIADPHYHVGRMAYSRGDSGAAKQHLGKYLELRGAGSYAADAHFMLGFVAMREAQGQEDASAIHKAAKAHLEKGLELKPNAPQSPQAHYLLGIVAEANEDTESAIAHFEKYLRLEPEGPQAEEIKKFLKDLKESEAG